MNKIDEVLELLKQRERESEKPKNVILWVLAIVEDDFDDDFDDYFEDEDEDK